MSATTSQSTPRDPVSEDEAFRQACERLIDEELDESFPASDPPSWVQGTAPVHH